MITKQGVSLFHCVLCGRRSWEASALTDGATAALPRGGEGAVGSFGDNLIAVRARKASRIQTGRFVGLDDALSASGSGASFEILPQRSVPETGYRNRSWQQKATR